MSTQRKTAIWVYFKKSFKAHSLEEFCNYVSGEEALSFASSGAHSDTLQGGRDKEGWNICTSCLTSDSSASRCSFITSPLAGPTFFFCLLKTKMCYYSQKLNKRENLKPRFWLPPGLSSPKLVGGWPETPRKQKKGRPLQCKPGGFRCGDSGLGASKRGHFTVRRSMWRLDKTWLVLLLTDSIVVLYS